MSTARTTSSRRPLHLGRTALVSVTAAAGMFFTALPASAATTAPAAPISAAGPIVAPTSAAQVVVDTALAQQGDAYVWAGSGPEVFDCSGLTQFAFAAAGISLPHSSRMQSAMGTPVAQADLQPGDMVFFYSPVSHVGIYLGNGQIVHAPTAGDVVKVSDLSRMYGFATARRLT